MKSTYYIKLLYRSIDIFFSRFGSFESASSLCYIIINNDK